MHRTLCRTFKPKEPCIGPLVEPTAVRAQHAALQRWSVPAPGTEAAPRRCCVQTAESAEVTGLGVGLCSACFFSMRVCVCVFFGGGGGWGSGL